MSRKGVLSRKGGGACVSGDAQLSLDSSDQRIRLQKTNFSVIGTLFLIIQLVTGKRKTLKSTNIAEKLQNQLSRVLNLVKEMKGGECQKGVSVTKALVGYDMQGTL